jgi:hypothetical protein
VSNRVANTISKIDMTPTPWWPTTRTGRPGLHGRVGRRPLHLPVLALGAQAQVIDMVEKKVVRQVNVGKSPHGVWTLAHAPR